MKEEKIASSSDLVNSSVKTLSFSEEFSSPTLTVTEESIGIIS
jgi:hypothetical protein